MGLFAVKVARKFKANSNPKVIEDNIYIYISSYIYLCKSKCLMNYFEIINVQ